MSTSNNNSGKKNQSGKGNQKGKSKKNYNKQYRNKKDNFQGDCDGLKGKVYYVGSAKQADNYNNTTKAILAYIQRTFNHGTDVMQALDDLNDIDTAKWRPKPETADATASDMEKKMVEQINASKVKKYVDQMELYEDNMNKAYALILGQCAKTLKAKLEARKELTLPV